MVGCVLEQTDPEIKCVELLVGHSTPAPVPMPRFDEERALVCGSYSQPELGQDWLE